MELAQETTLIAGRQFTFPKWSMRKQLQHQNVILPLIKDPMVNAVAVVSDGDEEQDQGMFMAAMLSGVIDSLTKADMGVLEKACLGDVTFVNQNGIPKMATVEELEKDGLDISAFYEIVLHVIKTNYSPFFKGGLQRMMQAFM
jgi:hypothetical protein